MKCSGIKRNSQLKFYLKLAYVPLFCVIEEKIPWYQLNATPSDQSIFRKLFFSIFTHAKTIYSNVNSDVTFVNVM